MKSCRTVVHVELNLDQKEFWTSYNSVKILLTCNFKYAKVCLINLYAQERHLHCINWTHLIWIHVLWDKFSSKLRLSKNTWLSLFPIVISFCHNGANCIIMMDHQLMGNRWSNERYYNYACSTFVVLITTNLFSGSNLSMFLNTVIATGTVLPNFQDKRNYTTHHFKQAILLNTNLWLSLK